MVKLNEGKFQKNDNDNVSKFNFIFNVLLDLKYFTLIILTLWTLLLCWIPFQIAGIFAGDSLKRKFLKLFKRYY